MSLNKPQFESMESTDGQAADNQVQVSQEAVESAKVDSAKVEGEKPAATTTAVAEAKTSALANPKANPAERIQEANVLNKKKGVMPVSWEDFVTINANNGVFQNKSADGESIGDSIDLRLLSTQPQWVSSPGDMNAEGDGLVLYSDDGINAAPGATEVEEHVEYLRSKGIEDRDVLTVKEHQAWLKAEGHRNAHVQHKIILVGKLLKANDKAMDIIGDLVQVHLPDTGRRAFESHAKQSAFNIVEGDLAAEDAEYVRLTAKTAGTMKKQYTQIAVGYVDGHGKKAKV